MIINPIPCLLHVENVTARSNKKTKKARPRKHYIAVVARAAKAGASDKNLRIRDVGLQKFRSPAPLRQAVQKKRPVRRGGALLGRHQDKHRRGPNIYGTSSVHGHWQHSRRPMHRISDAALRAAEQKWGQDGRGAMTETSLLSNPALKFDKNTPTGSTRRRLFFYIF